MDTKGCYYLNIFFPSNILLPEQTSYNFAYEGRNVGVSVLKHLKSLNVNDFDNRIIVRPDKSLSLDKTGFEISKSNLSTKYNGIAIVY